MSCVLMRPQTEANMIDTIQAEIENMKAQQQRYLELYQQATGAIASLEWTLQQLKENEVVDGN